MGRLIPAGTGFEYYRNVRIPADEPPPPPVPPQPTDEDMEFDREMEYLVEPEEALAPAVLNAQAMRKTVSGLVVPPCDRNAPSATATSAGTIGTMFSRNASTASAAYTPAGGSEASHCRMASISVAPALPRRWPPSPRAGR